jgi:hypothetical protein
MNKRLCPSRAATQAVTRETLWFHEIERPGLNTPGLASRYRVRPCCPLTGIPAQGVRCFRQAQPSKPHDPRVLLLGWEVCYGSCASV